MLAKAGIEVFAVRDDVFELTVNPASAIEEVQHELEAYQATVDTHAIMGNLRVEGLSDDGLNFALGRVGNVGVWVEAIPHTTTVKTGPSIAAVDVSSPPLS